MLSHTPGDQFPSTGPLDLTPVAHLLLYCVTGILMSRALNHTFPGLRPWQCAAWTLALGLLWGVSDEWHQEVFVYWRGWNDSDLVMDGIGLALGNIVWRNFSPQIFIRERAESSETSN
ncbi:VanZ family protein [Candidatus Sumerlaeota bacterium]|nr:VanZ family protein [Candidatus Sumerlaeota bacterium]